jgi:hypothetical protein
MTSKELQTGRELAWFGCRPGQLPAYHILGGHQPALGSCTLSRTPLFLHLFPCTEMA